MSTTKKPKNKQPGPMLGWNDDGEIPVVRRQDSVAVYLNVNGDIVIKQERWPDEEQLVIFGVAHAKRLIAAIRIACNSTIESDGGEA